MSLILATLLATSITSSQRNGDLVSSWQVVDALMKEDWPRVEAYKRKVGSFKHPIAPADAQSRSGDVLSLLAQYGSSSESYGRALVAMRIAMENGADPNEGGGMPLLYVTAADQWGKMVERLLKAGADPNKLNTVRPLLLAIEAKRVPSVRYLLAAGADPNAVTTTGYFRRPNPSARKPRYHDGKPYPTLGEATYYLTLAARIGNSEIVSLLLAAKAKVDAREPATGRTALHEAAETDRPEIVKLLLKAGASRAVRDKAGRTPLMAARRFGAKAAISALGG